MWNQVNIRSVSTTDFVNRQTVCRFSGEEIILDLSLGLFSSAGVDAGSLLLLKTIAKKIDLGKLSSILDVGCGVGTLGLSLAKRCPDAEVFMVDRDELAVDFTRHNADLNRLKNIRTASRLMLEGPHSGSYDLILSNFPAKAGAPVLRDYLNRSLPLLKPQGTAVIVIVYTLAKLCRELITEEGGEIVHVDASKQHTVFHYRSAANHDADSADNKSLLQPYIRNSDEFKIKRTRYNLDTVWNISDFDTLSWRLKLMGELINREPRYGVMVFWSPGQGHLPLAVCRQKGARPEKVILTGRDRLELLISAHNLKAMGTDLPLEIRPLADPGMEGCFGEKKSADLLITDLSPVPRTDWSSSLKDEAAKVLKTGGVWGIAGRSADVAVLTKVSRGWTTLEDKRTRGWRAVVYRKN
ncbi:MAG: hypothetical protein DRP70_01420 [Spirochaetes bacterium]|nr:MAG: hypothetical protein DRP70_01420 [Spirochaetota bacterium]